MAVAVHSTQFAIREPHHGMLQPVLELAARTIDAELAGIDRRFAKIASVCGNRTQALREAELARDLGYHAVSVSLGALATEPEVALLSHVAAVGEVLPVIGFYIQPAVGGRMLGYSFWRRFAEMSSVVAIKIAPFNRYGTLDVVGGGGVRTRRTHTLHRQ